MTRVWVFVASSIAASLLERPIRFVTPAAKRFIEPLGSGSRDASGDGLESGCALGILGVLAAGALVFLLSSLQRMAARIGDASTPGVEDAKAYRQSRKEDIYRAQLEELMADEQITRKARRPLHRLQDDLGLSSDAVNRLEGEVAGQLRVEDERGVT